MAAQPEDKAATGVEGLDDVLGGGFARGHTYLVEGEPGTGKTTLGLQFLAEGARLGEAVLYVTLSETPGELRSSAASHGWALDGVELFELASLEDMLDDGQRQSLLYSSDLELGETTRTVLERIEALRPKRVVFDSLAEIRLLAQGTLRYRRQVLALKQHFTRAGITVLLLDDMSDAAHDMQLQSIAHGVLRLEQLAPAYGAERRRLSVLKYRGARYRGGYHDFAIRTGGLAVFPRLVASEHRRAFGGDVLASGIAGLDALLGGGLSRGTSTLVMGPAGAGKSLLALQFAAHAAALGQATACFVFEEGSDLLVGRAKGVGIDAAAQVAAGRLVVHQVDAAELSPGEFAHEIRARVDRDDARVVVIDSLNGYYAAMPEEQFLELHMHELLAYLGRRGVTTIVTLAQHGLVGEMRTPVDVTYLSDTLVLLRFFEAGGRVRRAISVVKKRTGAHEDTIRELQVTAAGLRVGAPLAEFHGVLRGVPAYVGQAGPLLGEAAP